MPKMEEQEAKQVEFVLGLVENAIVGLIDKYLRRKLWVDRYLQNGSYSEASDAVVKYRTFFKEE